MNEENAIYQFKIALRGIRPPIWRRIQVPAHYSFWDLHVALQDAMGWLDYHLHAFRVIDPDTGDAEEIGIPIDDPFYDEPPCLAGWEVPLAAYFIEPGTRVDYAYDFGDGWEHEVVFEKVDKRTKGQTYPRCPAGERACPPEDCGGVWGYEKLLQIMSDPSHEEYKSTIEWLGGTYEAEAFNPKNVRFDDPQKRWKNAFGDR